jgi:hypothetical protein
VDDPADALEADLGAIRAQADADSLHGADREAERAGVREDALGDRWINRRRHAGWPRQRAAAEHELVAARDHVEDLARAALVGDGDRAIDRADLGDHDLAEQAGDRGIAGELAGSEAGAVDHAIAGLVVERVDRAALDRPAQPGGEPRQEARRLDPRRGEPPGQRPAGDRRGRASDVDLRRPPWPRRGVALVGDLVAGDRRDAGRGVDGKRAEPRPGLRGPHRDPLGRARSVRKPGCAGDRRRDRFVGRDRDHADVMAALLERQRGRQSDDTGADNSDLHAVSIPARRPTRAWRPSPDPREITRGGRSTEPRHRAAARPRCASARTLGMLSRAASANRARAPVRSPASSSSQPSATLASPAWVAAGKRVRMSSKPRRARVR